MPLTWTKLQPLLYLSEEGPTSLMFPIHQQSWFSQSRESRTQSGNISNVSILTSFIIIWSFSSQHDNRPHILIQSHQFDAIISSTLLQSSLGNSFIKYCLYEVRHHHAQRSPCRVSCQKSSVFPTVYGLFRGLYQGRWKPALIVPPNQFSISLKQGNGCVSIDIPAAPPGLDPSLWQRVLGLSKSVGPCGRTTLGASTLHEPLVRPLGNKG